MHVGIKKFFRIIFAIVILLGCWAMPNRCQAQVVQLFKSKNNRQLFTLWNYCTMFIRAQPDSAIAHKMYDSIIDIGRATGNDELVWYANYFKKSYDCFTDHSNLQTIQALYGIEDWVNSTPYEMIKSTFKHSLGMQLYLNNDYAEAIHLMLQAEESFEKTGFDNIPDICDYLYNIASSYYEINDYKNVIKYSKLAENYHSFYRNIDISKLNTEAMAYIKLGDYANGKKYLSRAIDSAKKVNLFDWIGIASGNYGYVLMLEGNYKAAIPYLSLDYETNRIEIPNNSALTSLRLAQCYSKVGLHDSADYFFNQALHLKGVDYNPDYKRYYLRLLAQYYFANNNNEMAYRYADSMLKISDSLDAHFSTTITASAVKRVQTEVALTNKNLLEEKQKDSLVIRSILFIALVVVLGLVLILFYNRHRSSLQKQGLLQAEKNIAEEKLHHAEAELKAYIKNIFEKNDISVKANTELKELQDNIPGALPTEKLEKLAALFELTILTDEDWSRFKQLFDEVHPLFFTTIKDRYSSFTPAETRLLALLKLNLNNKEMSAMIGVSANSITRTKYRLRKKLEELGIQEDLEQFTAAL